MLTAHLTYNEYLGLGGTAEEADFSRLEALASQLVDRATHGRIRDETPLRGVVKCALVQLIDAQARSDAHDGREVAAMSNDGVSVTYATGDGDASNALRIRQGVILRAWLDGEVTKDGVNLLYAGVEV